MREFLISKFELSRGGGAHNVRPMEGLRGFAVGLVFLVHYMTLVQPWINSAPLLGVAHAVHTMGNTGVDLFFVLSGYLIYGSLISRPQNFFSFMRRRAVRIYPAFLAVFCLYLLLSFLFPAENKIPSPVWKGAVYLLLNLIFVPGIVPIEPMITVAWSLSYEMFYYLMMPLLIVVFRLRGRSAGWRVALFLLAAVAIELCGVTLGGPLNLVMFIAGILLYELMQRPKAPLVAGWIGLLALTAGLLVNLIPLWGTGAWLFKTNVVLLSFLLLCLACFREPTAFLPRLFSWTPLRWLGNMSYSYYLLHGLVLKAAFFVLPRVVPKGAIPDPLFMWGLLPLVFVLTLVFSALLFLCVERPFSLAPKQSGHADGRAAGQNPVQNVAP